MKKYILASLIGIAALAIATPALAYKGNPDLQGPNYSPARHEAMEKVFSTNDFQGWLKLMEGKAWRLKEVVNTEAKFKELVRARKQGEDAMLKFRTENNLGVKAHMGQGRNR